MLRARCVERGSVMEVRQDAVAGGAERNLGADSENGFRLAKVDSTRQAENLTGCRQKMPRNRAVTEGNKHSIFNYLFVRIRRFDLEAGYPMEIVQRCPHVALLVMAVRVHSVIVCFLQPPSYLSQLAHSSPCLNTPRSCLCVKNGRFLWPAVLVYC